MFPRSLSRVANPLGEHGDRFVGGQLDDLAEQPGERFAVCWCGDALDTRADGAWDVRSLGEEQTMRKPLISNVSDTARWMAGRAGC